jgi:hypothetical protein
MTLQIKIVKSRQSQVIVRVGRAIVISLGQIVQFPHERLSTGYLAGLLGRRKVSPTTVTGLGAGG